MSGDRLKWMQFATEFPAGLDTETDATSMKDGFTPDAFGMGIEYPGLLYASAIPSGSSAIKKTYTISEIVWSWFYNRLWRASGSDIIYNAPEYSDVVYPQGISVISFDEDTQDVITFFPIGGGMMYVGKSTGGYVVSATSDPYARFTHGNIMPEIAVSAATNAVEYNGMAFISNSLGLISFDGDNSTELTNMVRSRSASYQSKALTVDYSKGRIIGASSFVYDIPSKKFFDYSSTGFRYTSRTLVAPTGKSFTVTAVAFRLDNVDARSGQIRFQIKLDDGKWTKEINAPVKHVEEEYNRSVVMLETPVVSRSFTIRLTGIDGNIRIRAIDIEASNVFPEESNAQ